MGSEELERVLAAVDFERETLFVVWIGGQQNATGSILIRDLDYDTRTRSWRHSVLVGVRPGDCDESPVMAMSR